MPPKTPTELTVPQKEQLGAVLEWSNAAITEADGFLRSQPGYDKIGPSIRRINSQRDELQSTRLSQVTSNRFAHIALTQSASLTDIKPFWEYRTENKRYEQQAVLANKLALHKWLMRKQDVKFADCIKYCLAGATSYAHLVYNKSIDDQDFLALGPLDVLPIRPNSGYDIQDCFGVLIRQERSVNYLVQRFGEYFTNLIKPDRYGTLEANERYSQQQRQLEAMGITTAPFWAAQEKSLQKSNALTVPMCDLWTLYVKDQTRNEGSKPKFMGEEGDPNGYWIKPGELLYPRLRRIEFCSSVVFADRPSPYWHGMFPTVKLTLDQWPWGWLGKSPMWDLLPLQAELDEMIRAIGDIVRQFAQPGIAANQNAIARAVMDKLNTRMAGMKYRTNPAAGPQSINMLYPQGIQLEALYKHVEFLINEMETLSGVRDIAAVMRLGQIPSSETIEKMVEAMTPLVRLRSRALEAVCRDFAMITLSNLFQFETLPKRLATLGPQGMTFEDFDSDPNIMVPAFIEEAGLGSDSTRQQRAAAMLRMFTYNVAPGSLLSASEVTNKMLYFQLWRAGLLDRETLAEKLSIPNYGELPGVTILEKLASEQQMFGPQMPSPAGRPATGQASPKMTGSGAIRES